MPRSSSKPSSRRTLWTRLGIIGGVALIVLGLAAVGGRWLANQYIRDKIPEERLLPPEAIGKDISGAVNILLLGMDERTGELDLIHADSIIIMHVNAQHTKAYLISIPRDSIVKVPAYPASRFNGTSQAKLTEAFAYGNRKFTPQGGIVGDNSPEGRRRGVDLLSKVLIDLAPGLKFNALAILNFDGFQKLVEAMGGIDNMCVDELTRSEHYDKNGNYVSETYGNPKTAKTYPVGCYPMKPWEALDYVRQRKYTDSGLGDYVRQRHQQQFILTVFKQLYSKKTLTDVGKLTDIMDAAGKLLTVDMGGHEPLDWIFTLKGIKADDLEMIKTNGGQYSSLDIGGISYQKIVPGTIDLLGAARDDTIELFLAAHPTWRGGDSVTLPTPTGTPTRGQTGAPTGAAPR